MNYVVKIYKDDKEVFISPTQKFTFKVGDIISRNWVKFEIFAIDKVPNKELMVARIREINIPHMSTCGKVGHMFGVQEIQDDK